jgi:hypothetical protein
LDPVVNARKALIVNQGTPIEDAKRNGIATGYWHNFPAWFNTSYP